MAVEKLEIETYFGKCKCCLNYGYLRTMWEKHIVDDVPEIYGQMLTQCFSIEWTTQKCEEDDQICEDCVWKLREAFRFKNQVLECQKALNCVQVDDEMEIKSETDNENYIVEYLDEEYLEYDNNQPNSEESVDERESEEEKHSEDEDYLVYKGDDDTDENYNPQDEDDEDIDSPVPRKRRAPHKSDDNSDTDTKPKWPKKLPKEERWKTYKQYTEEALSEAVEAVVARSMNQKEASKRFKVPRKTLSAKVLAVRNAESSERPLTRTKPTAEPEIQDKYEAMLIIKKHRENIHSVLAYSNATPIRGHWGLGYVCAFCPEQFKEASALKSHTRSHADIQSSYTVAHVRSHVARLDVTDLTCNICNSKMKGLQHLMRHLKSQHDKPMHFDINNHMVPFKFDTIELECVECTKPFTNFKLLSEHMADKHYGNYVCEKCDRGFINKVNLVAHRETHRIGIFYCDYCGKAFDTRRKKTTHERLSHTVSTKYETCGYCKMRFENAAQRNNHELRAHKKQLTSFDCNLCDKRYAQQRTLRDHIKKEHLLQRPYKCTQNGCDKSFYLNRALQTHILTHTDSRPFPCPKCPKTYRSVKALKGHMYKHTDKKEYKCTKCHKSFVLKENLTRHKREKHGL